jgi:hypothetical protein
LPRDHRSTATAIGFLAILVLAGCATPDPGVLGPRNADVGAENGGPVLRGVVVDTELVPIANATIVLPDIDLATMSDGTGGFELGLPYAGTHTAIFEKIGYRTVVRSVEIHETPTDRLIVTLEPIALDVPYHETLIEVTYTQCWLSAGPAGVPCIGFIDYLTNQQLSDDKSTVNFKVDKPGLAALLIELTFLPQNLGHDAVIVVREPGSIYSGAQKSWLLQYGGSPIRALLVPGEVGEGGDDPFEEPPGTEYMALIGGWNTNNSIPSFGLHLDFRTEDYFTFFYNRMPSPGFTVLPDQ